MRGLSLILAISMGIQGVTGSAYAAPAAVRSLWSDTSAGQGPVVFNSHPNSIYFTLKPNQAYVGPFVTRNANTHDTQAYFQAVFREIVRKADTVFRDMDGYKYVPGANDNFTYYTFLVLALTVPHHESNLMHARQALGSQCSQRTNEVALSNSKVRAVLRSIYRKPGKLIFPNCSSVSKSAETLQVLNSGNHDDVGFMQLNPRFHSVGVQPEVFFNLPRTIDYGLNYIVSGFEHLRANAQSYSCSFTKDPFRKSNSVATIFYNLVRATWASKYNQGNVQPRAVCRFARSNGKDNAFRASLDSIVKNNNSLFHQYLPEGSVERAALREIVSNYRAAFTKAKEPEQNTNLKAILQQATVPGSTVHASVPLVAEEGGFTSVNSTKTVHQEPLSVLKTGLVRIYSRANESIPYNCGYVDAREGTLSVRTHAAGPEGRDLAGWLQVDLEGHSRRVHLFKTQLFVETKAQYSYANLREAPSMTDGRLVARLYRSVNGRKQMMRVMQQFRHNNQRWFRVIDRQGKSYYVHESGVDLREIEAPAPAACQSPILYVKAADVTQSNLEFRAGKKFIGQVQGEGRAYLRSMFSTQAGILEVKNPGDEVLILSQTKAGDTTWYKVMTSNGREAWVWSDRVKLVRAADERGR